MNQESKIDEVNYQSRVIMLSLKALWIRDHIILLFDQILPVNKVFMPRKISLKAQNKPFKTLSNGHYSFPNARIKN